MAQTASMTGVAGLTIVEMQGSVAGAYATRLLADQGA